MKYVLIPLKMDKKKIYKNTRPNMAPEKLPGDDSLFLYHFFVDSMKGDAQKKTEKEKRTRKHLQHKKNC